MKKTPNVGTGVISFVCFLIACKPGQQNDFQLSGLSESLHRAQRPVKKSQYRAISMLKGYLSTCL
ncbi:Endonuclease [Pseudomonas syringae pv. actinidiae]|uniref:Endonuclease n=1 Tax=Pseudomonas syringae pv. actinidiae TaxID=103796 RepID=A0AAN4Q1M2_PSESF|nr:Endonuclease [Pseudomonas syringae pv. actinidiae]